MKKKRIVIAGLVLALTAGSAFGVKALFFSEDEQVTLTGTTTYGSLATTLEGTGTTIPADSYTVTAASDEAKITAVYVSAGDTVEAGDPLYTQDDSELDDQIDEYKDQLSELQETLSALTVQAPFSGRVMELNVEQGDEVQKGTSLLTLVDDSKMTLTEYFSYAYEDQIYVGMAAGVSISSLMNTFTGTVTDIEKVERLTAEGTRTFAVTITLDNPGALTEGMTGAAWVTADSGEKLYPAVEGSLEYYNSKTLTAEAAGELLTVNTVDYQKVSAGQTLITIDGSDYRDQIASAQEKITQAQQRIVTYQERMAEVEEKRSDYNVTSEVSGKVIMVNVREGETPRSGSTAVAVYNLDNMEISANIDELDIDKIEMGMEVQIVKSSSSGESETYTGTVTEISYEATNSNGVAYFPITISIPSEGALSAGVNDQCRGHRGGRSGAHRRAEEHDRGHLPVCKGGYKAGKRRGPGGRCGSGRLLCRTRGGGSQQQPVCADTLRRGAERGGIHPIPTVGAKRRRYHQLQRRRQQLPQRL